MTGPLRYCIDSLVLIIAALWLLPLIFGFFTPFVDDVTPDATLVLDERILEAATDYDANFADLVAQPTPRSTYDLQYGLETDPLYSDVEIYELAFPSVVYIYSITPYGDYSGAGSVVTHDGIIMTNYHNVEDAQQVMVVTHDGRIHPVIEVLAYDTELDVAFLQIPVENLVPAVLGDTDKVEIGEHTLVIGHPEGFINTLSSGIVSGVRDYVTRDAGSQLQITNPISAGNSGGVVLNQHGHVIGIPTSAVEYEENSVQVQNINLAVPINDALSILEL